MGQIEASELDRLPHRPPFRFVTSVELVERGVRAEGLWRLTGQEEFFRGHFPGDPVVPGVLIGEALAQISGLVVSAEVGATVRLAQVDLKFVRGVTPPVDIRLKSRMTRTLGRLRLFDVRAETENDPISVGTLTLAVGEGDTRS